MANMWYYAHDENRMGPFSQDQLKELAGTGSLLSSDTVWKEGVEKGVLASRVKNLFPVPNTVFPEVINPPEIEAATMAAPVDAESKLVEEADHDGSPPVEAVPEKPADDQAKAHQKPTNRGRAVAMKGAEIVNQDGTQAKYRKKCSVCGHNDSSCHTIAITNKIMKTNFFCPKCRKRREVTIRCTN
jgi:hypothetical protein